MQVRFGEFALDRGGRQLLRGSEPVPLGPKAFELLDLLLGERPRAVSKARIRDRLWPKTFVSESNLTSLVAELRAALGDEPRQPRFVRTVYGFGYAFCGAVTAVPAARSAATPPRPRFRLFLEEREIALREGENVLGRADEAAAWIDSPQASRCHARILVSGGQAILEDLGSKNGTFLRGELVRSPSALADGDEIRIGRVLITFRAFADSGSTEAEGQG